MVHMCKMMISPGAIFIFSKFWFCGLLGDKMAKNGPKLQNILCLTYYVSQGFFFFFHFFKILIFWIFRWGEGGRVKGEKMTHNYQFHSVTLYISRTVDHMIKIVSTQVHRCKIISPGASLYFLKKIQHCKY